MYDLEELAIGYRISHLLGAVLTPEFVDEAVANPGRFRAASAGLREALAALVVRRDPDAAERALARVRGVNLPPPAAAFRELAEGILRSQRGDPAAALERFDAADRLLPGMPLLKLYRAAALNDLARYDEALAGARDYLQEVGPDSLGHSEEGYALEGQGRLREAADAYRKSLDEEPNEVDALAGLRRVLPDAEKGELADRLARTRDPTDVFDRLIHEARDEDDTAGADALVAGLRKARPDDPRAEAEAVRGLVRDGKYPEAAARVRGWLLGNKPPAARTPVLNAYLSAMHAAGRPLDAYAAVPDPFAAEAFRTLAAWAGQDAWHGPPDKSAPAADRLRHLVAAHRKRDPGDAWLRYYEGRLLEAAGEFEKAERVYADGAARLEAGAPADAAGREAFRARRVECLYALKRGLKAYADVGPPADTFRQLARRYSQVEDADGLAALVAAHEERFPADRVLEYWLAEVHYLKGDHADAAAGFARYRRASREGEPERWPALDKQVRSLVRAGEPRQAAVVVDEAGPDEVSDVLRAVVAAASGDVDGLDRLMAGQAARPAGLVALYDDPDFARLIAGPKFADLRKKYPRPRPDREID